MLLSPTKQFALHFNANSAPMNTVRNFAGSILDKFMVFVGYLYVCYKIIVLNHNWKSMS